MQALYSLYLLWHWSTNFSRWPQLKADEKFSAAEYCKLYQQEVWSQVVIRNTGFTVKILSSCESASLRMSLARAAKLKINYTKVSKVTYLVVSICAARNLYWWNASLRKCENRRQGICLPPFDIVNQSVVYISFLYNEMFSWLRREFCTPFQLNRLNILAFY